MVTYVVDLIAQLHPGPDFNRNSVHMHPQSSDKSIRQYFSSPHPSKNLRPSVCKEFFEALELCHANVWTKWTGGCNEVKRELNKCLHTDVRPPSLAD